MKLKCGDTNIIRVKGDLTATVWKDKWDVNMLMNMHHHPPAEGHFCDEHGNSLRSQLEHKTITDIWGVWKTVIAGQLFH
jgi:hypothetical protein